MIIGVVIGRTILEKGLCKPSTIPLTHLMVNGTILQFASI